VHQQEDARLLDGHKRHGNKWTLIAQEIGGRTDNAVKNRWAALEKKRKFGDEAIDRPILRTNDLLAVRRIISKDQPRQRLSNAVDAPWMLEYQSDMQHPVYNTSTPDYTPLQGTRSARRNVPCHQADATSCVSTSAVANNGEAHAFMHLLTECAADQRDT